MSTTENGSTSYRAWRGAWQQLSPARRVSVIVRWLLLIVVALGGFACLAACARWMDVSPALEASLDGFAAAFVVGLIAIDPPQPLDPSDPELGPTAVHSVACMLAMALLPWIICAGFLGADLSTRPDFYAQVAQIIPVLLLAILFERRFFPVRGGLSRDEQYVVRSGFALLVGGPALTEVLALTAIASHVQWIEVGATVLAASTIPALLVLIAGPVLITLYEPPPADATP